MPSVSSRFFGDVDYSPESVFVFPSGLPGFETHHDFVFLNQPDSEPLIYMQSLTSRTLCFVALPVLAIDPEFQVSLTAEELADLELPPARQPVIGKDILCAAVISLAPDAPPCANMMAPLVINLKSSRGLQVIHPESGYSHRHPLDLAKKDSSC